ncbi:hypothetical protein WSS_A25975 [Rhodococcus opacus M213]|uniref:Uncharacterized protein n=1 Tax=Rhodococcus opacus M213 TaxID=1129896 RepID=K8XFY1_RHOOP|nr:hypothetical protein [Rhodococcus opacus]EKT79736.1 hypothetical protein WSS_A25975 [Rhodococcus opacus M213]
MQLKYATARSGPDAALIDPDSPLATTAPFRFHQPSMVFFEENLRPGGTNGYTTSWGTNAHGKLAGCPPSAH